MAGDDKTTTKTNRRTKERRAGDRRETAERRKSETPVAKERRKGDERRTKAGGERRKVERRINEYRLEPEVLEFINAVNDFKSVNQKPFPTWSEIYGIFTALGYRKVEE